MSIWNKVLLGLIAAALLPFFYLAARALKTQQYWEAQAKQCEKNLKDADEQNRKLVEADKLPNGNLGTDAARRELYSVLIGRGRVWNNCEPAKVDRATGHVKLKTDQPVAPVAFGGIAPHMTLHAVEEADVQNGGRYLGEFKVVQVIDKERTVELAPTRSLDADELTRLARSKGPWTMYEVMPVDKHEPFAGLNPQELKELLPASSLAEYEKDGQDAAPGDPEERVRGGKYVRRLRDYGAIYENAHLQRSLFTDVYESALRDQQYMDEALASAREQESAENKEVAKMKIDLAAVKREADAVSVHLAAVKRKLAAIEEDVVGKIAANLALAREIAKTQLDVARRIDDRTRSIARRAPGAG